MDRLRLNYRLPGSDSVASLRSERPYERFSSLRVLKSGSNLLHRACCTLPRNSANPGRVLTTRGNRFHRRASGHDQAPLRPGGDKPLRFFGTHVQARRPVPPVLASVPFGRGLPVYVVKARVHGMPGRPIIFKCVISRRLLQNH